MNQYVFNLGYKIVNSVGVIVFTIILGNTISQKEVGLYSLVLLASAYGISFLTLKINPSIIQRLNDKKNNALKNHYFTTGLISTLFFGFFIVFFYWFSEDLIMLFFNLQDSIFIYLASFLAFLLIIRGYVDHVLMSLLENKYLFFTSLVSFALNIAFYITISFFIGFDVNSAIYSLYISNIAYILIACNKIFDNYKIIIDRKLYECSKSILSFSFIVYFVAIANFMDSNIDLVIINQYLDKEHVAIYNYAIKISMLFLLVGASISNVNYPKISKLYSENEIMKISNLMHTGLKVNFFIIFVTSILFLSLSNEIINLLLPKEYNPIVNILFFLVPGIVLYSGFMAVKSLFNAMNMPSVGLIVAWGSLFINLILSLVLIPIYGMEGGAISTIISYIFNPLCILFLVRIKTSISLNINFLYYVFPIYLICVYLIYLNYENLEIKLPISIIFILLTIYILNPIKEFKRYRK